MRARDAYAQAHLRGARFLDAEHDLASHVADASRGGRHPLPPATAFAITLGRLGIGPETDVVICDDQGGVNAAARAWWMLRALGHTRAYVLDGGLAAARAAGLPFTAEVPPPAPRAAYPADRWLGPTVALEEVDAVRLDPRFRVLDVRAAVRFRGEQEHIDPIAGHIPGAVNLPLTENLGASGCFRSAEALRATYAALLGDVPPGRLIVYCGSGVTACHTLLALERAGLPGARLYVGSWGEWCRRPALPRAP